MKWQTDLFIDYAIYLIEFNLKFVAIVFRGIAWLSVNWKWMRVRECGV